LRSIEAGDVGHRFYEQQQTQHDFDTWGSNHVRRPVRSTQGAAEGCGVAAGVKVTATVGLLAAAATHCL
jgi:hypothetical protein